MTIARRMVKKAVQQGHSKRRGEAYFASYVEPLSDARTKLADFFNILLVGMKDGKPGAQRFRVRANLFQNRGLLPMLENTVD
jgi:hypothetical protein